MKWRGEPRNSDGVLERDYEYNVGGTVVPGTLWTPADAGGPFPLVLLGYGGGGHRRDGARIWQGGWYAKRGIAASSIDLPGHGERALPSGERPHYVPLVDEIVGEWRGCLDELTPLSEIDEQFIGYRGVSMATMLGLPFVAAEPRIRAAIFGAADLEESPPLFTGISARLRRDVPRVTCPVLFTVGWDDQIVDRQSAFELFGLLGSTDKEMRVYSGGHGYPVPPGVTETVMQYLVDRLQPTPHASQTSL